MARLRRQDFKTAQRCRERTKGDRLLCPAHEAAQMADLIADLAREVGTLAIGTDVNIEADVEATLRNQLPRAGALDIRLVGGHLRQHRCVILLLRVDRDVSADCV